MPKFFVDTCTRLPTVCCCDSNHFWFRVIVVRLLLCKTVADKAFLCEGFWLLEVEVEDLNFVPGAKLVERGLPVEVGLASGGQRELAIV